MKKPANTANGQCGGHRRHTRGVYLIAAGLAAGLMTLTGALDGGPPRQSGWRPVPGVRPAAAEEKLKAGMVDPKTGKKIKYWVAPMDPTYIRKEPGKSPMGMDLVPVYEDDNQTPESPDTIRVDPATIQNMGVRTGLVERKPAEKTIRTFGNITYDETLIYAVNTKFDGWIERLFVDFEGQQVKRGQPLFSIYSPALVTAQEEYLLALEQYRQLGESDFPQVRESARRLLEAARTRLRYWDVSEAQIRQLEKDDRVRKALTVYSPANGVVIKKDALEGHFVKAGEHQYEIADLSRVWVDVDIYAYELPWVRKGMEAQMELNYIPGERFTGHVLFIYPYLNAKTRTATLRLEFPNPEDRLKPDMYATIYLYANLGKEVLVIPQEAVIDSGLRKVVFLALGEGRFRPREVKLGLEVNETQVQVLEGLKAGERIVTSAQFMLDSESRLQEAIQKMLEPQKAPAAGSKGGTEDLDMSGMKMDDDLDMQGLSMDGSPDGPPSKTPKPPQKP